jgi:hypothetical protein
MEVTDRNSPKLRVLHVLGFSHEKGRGESNATNAFRIKHMPGVREST